EEEALHSGIFGMEDFGGAFWQAVVFDGERYKRTPLIGLAADSGDYALFIEINEQLSPSQPAGGRSIGFTVRDGAGNTINRANLLVMAASPNLPVDNMLNTLYAPNRYSGLPDWPPPIASLSRSAITIATETLFFDIVDLDKNGRADLHLLVPPGEWQLYAWAVADAALPLAGNASLPLIGPPQTPVDTTAYPANKDNRYLSWATRYDMGVGNSHFIHEGLLFLSSAERVQAMELLWQALFTSNISVEQYLAGAYANVLWQKYGYGEFTLPQELGRPYLSVFQKADGGLAGPAEERSDLWLSMLAASLVREGFDDFDIAALTRYLYECTVGNAPPEEKAMALAGLAALGEPVLQELKLLLAQPGQTVFSHACLIFGLVQAGDLQVAKIYFQDFLYTCATDATTGIFYLEGGQGRNIRLNRLGAMLSAACGKAYTAFAFLQYLQNQQECDELSMALVAGSLLPQLYISASAATLALDGQICSLEAVAFDDIWLEQPASGNLFVEATEGDLAMTCLRLMQTR
ncbi:MAG: hypothetical protein FWF04_00465, partial [Clostridiales bacterium]|nr:hypothetical protein [Clostridiales bacterium]